MSRAAVVVTAMLVCACGASAPRAPSVDVPVLSPSPARSPSREPRNVAITGGTLAIARDGRSAIAADPDRDRVWIVDLDTMLARAPVDLRAGDEPGRVAEDARGYLHVALRRGGAIATIDPSSGAVVLRREICAAPRGIAYDELEDALHVACTDGALVTLGALEPAPRRRLQLDRDLRDVVVDGDFLHVSRFRAASVTTLDRAGHVVARRVASEIDLDALERIEPESRPRRTFVPRVAWRLVAGSRSGELWMLHQRAAAFPIDMQVTEAPALERLPYGGMRSRALRGCEPGIAHAGLTRFAGARSGGTILPSATLPVDVALSPDGESVAMAFAGEQGQDVAVAMAALVTRDPCAESRARISRVPSGLRTHAVAVAWIDAHRLAVQFRQPPSLVVLTPHGHESPREARLGDLLPRDGGHELFHRATPAGIACASCHPEGEEDGHVWQLGSLGGARRTQTLGGGVLAGPLHWAGDLGSLDALMDEVLVGRMGGTRPLEGDVTALARFLDALPPPIAATTLDAAAIARGRELFVERGCDDCHRGARLTDERTHDVGTGEPLQTPTLLGLATRAPYFHDGRVATLEARFESGHTAGHGDVHGMTEAQIAQMVAYLESL